MPTTRPKTLALSVLLSCLLPCAAETLRFTGSEGRPGNGKHIVLMAGDEEYRSEETCPMLAKILSKHHGFDTTVLFSTDPEGGFIDPNQQRHIPGTAAIRSADLVITGLRFRNLPDEQLQPLADHLNAGKPVFGFRTSTHAFSTKGNRLGGIDWDNFGPDVLGEGWVNHHGKHGVEGARGVANPEHADHPVLNGVGDVFAPSDVYGVKRVNDGNATVLLNGLVTASLQQDSEVVPGKEPQPSAWLREYRTPDGVKGSAGCSTMGSSCDLVDEGLRRLFVNFAYHLTGLQVPERAEVGFVDPFEPSRFEFIRDKDFYRNLALKPADFGYGKSPASGRPLAGLVNPKPRFADIPGPEIVSTVQSAAEQAKTGRRPDHYQPADLPNGPRRDSSLPMAPEQGGTMVFLGNSLAERMMNHDRFEGLFHANFPDSRTTFRNMGFPGHTPAFRPESGNPDPWAFPEGGKFRPEIRKHFGKGHYPSPDEWLTILGADTIVAFFGFNESFDGIGGLENFRGELAAFVEDTLRQGYDHESAPRLVLASPVATERPAGSLLPDADERNRILAAYAGVMREVAAEKGVGFVDLLGPTLGWTGHTINGVHLNEDGYAKLAPVLFEGLFGRKPERVPDAPLMEAIRDKNWCWRNDYRIGNGVHAYGGRWSPYGNYNYPEEIEKVRQMTVLRDRVIWDAAAGKVTRADDSLTRPLTRVTTNYRRPGADGKPAYLDEADALKRFTLPDGYEISAFATEAMFPNLANPMQMSFDNRGRLWVATMPSYPHYRPGDPRPDDKLLIYEDEDGDGRADREIVWADGLSLPIGFAFAPEGVYVAEGSRIVLLQDTDGDDRADRREIVLDGFDPHDTHHAISAFDVDNGGGIFMLEGRFLHSQVETPYGPQRMTDGGAWRWDPRSWRLERVVQMDVDNPWGMVHDEYGQNILNDASGGIQLWVGGYGVRMPHAGEVPVVGKFNHDHRVRPTSGSEIIRSGHFPDEVQGNYIYGNTIGFLGIKEFEVVEDGAELKGHFKRDLLSSDDGNFRPADMEIAPDGSLYLVDWHNALIGHMQHSARDPNRSKTFGRIYRITCPSRPLVDPPLIAGAPVDRLFENMRLPELRARKRSHLELRGRNRDEVVAAARRFAAANRGDERLVLEALWATWGHDAPEPDLLEACLTADDHRVRSAAVRVIRHSLHLIDGPEKHLLRTAADPHPRVRIETLTAASWLGGRQGAEVLLHVAAGPGDRWIDNALSSAMGLLRPDVEAVLADGGFPVDSLADPEGLLAGSLGGEGRKEGHMTASLRGRALKDKAFASAYRLGESVFAEDASCMTCHQADGMGLKDVYPPIAKSDWVTGDKDRLIKLVLHGLWGKIEVNGKVYDPEKGVPPMTAVGAMFDDREVAAVLTYVRSSWGNDAPMVTPDEVAEVREATRGRTMFYSPEELLGEHPFPEGE